jgi:hypothetical protein
MKTIVFIEKHKLGTIRKPKDVSENFMVTPVRIYLTVAAIMNRKCSCARIIKYMIITFLIPDRLSYMHLGV